MLRNALDLAEGCTPAVVLFEDLDRMVQAKGVSISHFLNLLDGLKVLNGVLVIATCNQPDRLDPALIHRPSRFDRVCGLTCLSINNVLNFSAEKEEHSSPNRH